MEQLNLKENELNEMRTKLEEKDSLLSQDAKKLEDNKRLMASLRSKNRVKMDAFKHWICCRLGPRDTNAAIQFLEEQLNGAQEVFGQQVSGFIAQEKTNGLDWFKRKMEEGKGGRHVKWLLSLAGVATVVTVGAALLGGRNERGNNGNGN